MLINPVLHDNVHSEGDTGSITDQVHSSKKYVQRLLKTKIQLLELEVSETQNAAILEGILAETPHHLDPTLILFPRHSSKSWVVVRC